HLRPARRRSSAVRRPAAGNYSLHRIMANSPTQSYGRSYHHSRVKGEQQAPPGEAAPAHPSLFISPLLPVFDDHINDAVFPRLLGTHDPVALHVTLDLVKCVPSVGGQKHI